MSLDTTFAEYPSTLSREWQIAQAYLISKRALTPAEKKEAFSQDPVDFETANNVYGKVMNRLNTRTSQVDSQMGTNLFEDMLLEKSHDLEKFKDKVQRGKNEKKSFKQITDEVLLEGKKFRNSQLSADDLLIVEEDEIKASIEGLMDQLLSPEQEKTVPKVKLSDKQKIELVKEK